MNAAKMDVLETNRDYWIKISVDCRTAYQIKQDCDDIWVNSLSNEQLVDKILVIAGYVDDYIVKAKSPSLGKGTAEMLVFLAESSASRNS